MKTIDIAREFSKTPGGRYKVDGQDSGEEFLEKFLVPLFADDKANETIRIVLDGSYGYPSSFLEEAFGGLARRFGVGRVLKMLEFVSNEEPMLVEEIRNYIEHSTGQK